MTSSPLKVLVVLGSMREGRMGDRVAKFITQAVERAGHQPTLLDPLTAANEGKVIQPLHFMRDQSAAPQWMLDTNATIKSSDCIMVVTPEYNCSLPPALLALLDNFPPASYRHKPAAIVSYSLGRFGGVRAAAIARPFLSELGLVSIPKTLGLPQVSEVLSAEGQCSDDRTSKNADSLVAELAWYAAALRTHAATTPPPS